MVNEIGQSIVPYLLSPCLRRGTVAFGAGGGPPPGGEEVSCGSFDGQERTSSVESHLLIILSLLNSKHRTNHRTAYIHMYLNTIDSRVRGLLSQNHFHLRIIGGVDDQPALYEQGRCGINGCERDIVYNCHIKNRSLSPDSPTKQTTALASSRGLMT